MKKERRNNLVYALFLIAVVLIVLSLFLVFSKEKPVQVQEFDVFFIVINESRIGFDVNNTLLTFGKIPLGSGGERKVIIDNNYNFPLEVKVLLSKNLLGLLDANVSVMVEPGRNVTIPIKLNIPEDFALGNYTGKVRFEMYKAE